MQPSPTEPRRPPRFCFLVAAVLWLVGAFTAQAVTVRDIPDPRPDSWVVDLTGTLDSGLRAQIDEVAQRVEDRQGELVAVLVKDLSGADPRTFATALGNRWNLNSRGALLLVATEARAAEIVLGHRVDGDAQVRISREIMDRRMVPHFRKGNFGAGLLAGAQAVERRILATETVAESSPSSAPQPLSRVRESAPPTFSLRRYLLGHPLAPAFAGLLAIGGMILGFVWTRRPPRCKPCQVPRVKLGELDDDVHLSSPERLEEDLGSVNYHLWACPSCGDLLKRRRERFFTRLKVCPGCGFVTMSRVRSVLEAATTASAGVAEVEEDCAHCEYHAVSHHTIPRKRDDSDSSSSSSSFGSSSRSSSSGGGFSSGRGASGRW